ncbi:DMT family transporter [Desulfocurvibacter africanus]|uniref:EamA domain-containing protein n=1 Tax=Desulfocurvibacter africanus subsp. africanus str. Walvis Bay TaxID=690850 RepID=F3Z0J4_DESAF|nr:DMT family transporter [Desulfocurvibacter africanus]EGJ51004.1 protein of unknown function DUF6 transmembrane [Desulfocurvibacter africanus subsp. africanus str. Walvis Bay]
MQIALVAFGSLSPGIRCMIIAAFWFSIGSAFTKLAGARLPFMEVVWVRAAFGLVFTLWLLHRAGIRSQGNRRGLLLARGLFGFSAMAMSFYGYMRLPLGEATVLFFLNPVFVAVLAALFLGERLNRDSVLCVLAGLGGALLIAKPPFLFGHGQALDVLGTLAALGGAFMAGCTYILVRKLGATEQPLTQVLYLSGVAFCCSGVPAAATWIWPSGREWLLLLGIGLATQAAQVFMTKGYSLEPAGRASAATYFQIPLAAVWSGLIFGDLPDVWSMLGTLLIVAATMVLGHTRKKSRSEHAEPGFQKS